MKKTKLRIKDLVGVLGKSEKGAAEWQKELKKRRKRFNQNAEKRQKMLDKVRKRVE